MSKVLHGHAVLELAREKKVNRKIKREVVNRIEKDNTITPFLSNLISSGNYCNSIPTSSIMPISQWFAGCMLTSDVNPDGGDVSGFFGMIAHNSEVTACAGSTDSMGTTDPRRGYKNITDSTPIPNGYKYVWDWGTDRGNGNIASICLSHPEIAASDYATNRIPAVYSSTNPQEVAPRMNMSFNTASESHYDFSSMQIIDYAKEVGYRVTYNSTSGSEKIVVTEYPLSTYRLHLLDSAWKQRKNKDGTFVQTVHEIAQVVSQPNIDYSNVSINYTGTHIHFVTWNNNVIKDYVINTTTWQLDSAYGTGGIITKTYDTAIVFTKLYTQYTTRYHKDVYPIIGDYIWMWGTVDDVPKIIKCPLLNSSITTQEYDNPYYTIGGIAANQLYRYSGNCIYMPNGDFYKFIAHTNLCTNLTYGNAPCLYYHNNKFFIGRHIHRAYSLANNGYPDIGYNSNAYGSVLFGGSHNENNGLMALEAYHGFVSTVNNLDTPVEKTNEFTMKLTYSITETTS